MSHSYGHSADDYGQPRNCIHSPVRADAGRRSRHKHDHQRYDTEHRHHNDNINSVDRPRVGAKFCVHSSRFFSVSDRECGIKLDEYTNHRASIREDNNFQSNRSFSVGDCECGIKLDRYSNIFGFFINDVFSKRKHHNNDQHRAYFGSRHSMQRFRSSQLETLVG